MAERVRSIVAFVRLSALDTDYFIRLWIKSTAILPFGISMENKSPTDSNWPLKLITEKFISIVIWRNFDVCILRVHQYECIQGENFALYPKTRAIHFRSFVLISMAQIENSSLCLFRLHRASSYLTICSMRLWYSICNVWYILCSSAQMSFCKYMCMYLCSEPHSNTLCFTIKMDFHPKMLTPCNKLSTDTPIPDYNSIYNFNA